MSEQDQSSVLTNGLSGTIRRPEDEFSNWLSRRNNP